MTNPIIITFKNFEEFETHVRHLPLNIIKQNEMIGHEVAHYKAAESLGYSGKYAIEEIRVIGKFSKYRGTVIFDQDITNPEHINFILSAPKDPSPEDLEEIMNVK